MMILVVEDNPKTRQMIKQIISSRVPSVSQIIESDDGEEAVELYLKFSPDLVLMDLNIKTIDGLQASKDILAWDSKARIIIVTLYDGVEYRETAKEIGASGFIQKENIHQLPELIHSNFK